MSVVVRMRRAPLMFVGTFLSNMSGKDMIMNFCAVALRRVWMCSASGDGERGGKAGIGVGEQPPIS